jgi:hypothetical protein
MNESAARKGAARVVQIGIIVVAAIDIRPIPLPAQVLVEAIAPQLEQLP